jgi:capsular exopolysaccharide synthesis family protein
MELRQYATIAWRWSWLLLLGALLAGLAAFTVSRLQTPVYEARATMLVNQSQAVTGPTYNDVLANQQLTKTYGQIVASSLVLDPVAQQTGLSYEELRKKVSAGVRRETQLIDITVRDVDPERAARLANDIGRAFAAQIRDAQLVQQTQAREDLELQARVVQAAISEKQQNIARLSAPQSALPEPQRQAQLSVEQSELTDLRQRLDRLNDNLQNLRVEALRSTNSVTPVNEARVPSSPVSPRTLFNTILGALVGLIVAAGFVAVFEYLDDTVKTAADVSRVTGLVTLGTIERFRQAAKGRRGPADTGAASGQIVATADAYSPTGEAYRMVRTNLEFARSGRPNRTILITSAQPGEGKSTTSANLAMALAQTGRRVVLVDADLRRPSLHRIFDLPNSTGLSTLFVMEQPTVAGLLRPTPMETLLLLPSGPLPPNPAELLASERMGEIITLLTADADIVIFDSPPLLSVADSVTLAARLDGVVLVVDAGRTRSGVLARAVELLSQANARVWGVVLNRVKARSGDGYYYYYGSGGDGRNDDRAERRDATPGPTSRAAVRIGTGSENGATNRRRSYAEEPRAHG